ncbi:hypothetical protein B296_00008283 [Ensete ventricosum]|uniref:Uncharacterized protein n=1 Tax=Ensete ventricosum TaxID=4639 RepID=A0A426YZ84_ENSVE|nr:hypothetical protein B296_00008283 [Ensete ventricosum]
MADEGCDDGYNFLEEETWAVIVMMGGRGWEQKASAAGERQRHLVRVAREGREMAGMTDDCGREERNRGGMADDSREERNRGGRQRKRRLRERAAATCDCCGRKGGKEDYDNGRQRLRRGGRCGSKDGWVALKGAVTPMLDLQTGRVSKAKEVVKAAAGRFGRQLAWGRWGRQQRG